MWCECVWLVLRVWLDFLDSEVTGLVLQTVLMGVSVFLS
jgi:hypothetical protein